MQGQDPYFSQFFANRLYLNPGWAGVEENKRFSLHYRNQWPSTDNAFVTYSASYDQYVEPLHGGIGFTVYNDVQGKGVITESGISAIYSYHLQVSRFLNINAGFQAGAAQRKLDTQNFIFGDMLNPDGSINPQGLDSYGNYSSSYPDFAFGLTGFYKNIYTGAAMYHLLKPSHTLSDDPNASLSRKFTFFGGAMIPVYEKRLGKEVVEVSPNIIYIQQGNFTQLNYGIEALYRDSYAAGIWLRQNLGIRYSSLIFSAGFAFERMMFRYSYDHQLSHPSVSLPPMGAHEISFIILMLTQKKKKHRTINCIKF